VQVDPLKPKLKPPVTKRLKLKYDGLLSNIGFKFNLRCYSSASEHLHKKMNVPMEKIPAALGRAVQVASIRPTLKAPGTKRLTLKCDESLSNFAFNFNLRRYSLAGGISRRR